MVLRARICRLYIKERRSILRSRPLPAQWGVVFASRGVVLASQPNAGHGATPLQHFKGLRTSHSLNNRRTPRVELPTQISLTGKHALQSKRAVKMATTDRDVLSDAYGP